MSLNALVRWLKPRETVFFDLLDASAANLLDAARAFDQGIKNGHAGKWDDFRRSIKEIEHKGDAITHEILDQLDKTFVTPIEREDILALAHALDDVVDCMDAAAERLVLYKIDPILPMAKQLSGLLVDGAEEMVPLISSLRTMSDVKAIRKRIRTVTGLENQSDAILHAALADLFENPTDPIYVIKWKEIFSLLEEATDRVELVAKVVGSTVMRNA